MIVVAWESTLFTYISLNLKLNIHFLVSRLKWLLLKGNLTRIPILIGTEFKKVDKKLNHYLDLAIQDLSILETGNRSLGCCWAQYCHFLFLAPEAQLRWQEIGWGCWGARFNSMLTKIPIKILFFFAHLISCSCYLASTMQVVFSTQSFHSRSVYFI